MSRAPMGPPRRVGLHAADGTALSATWVDGPPGSDAVVILLPGFWRRAASPRMAELAATLAREASVLSLDFRGHGSSAGRFTFGRLEHLDVEAALDFAVGAGARRAVLVGLSMGAASIVHTLGRPGVVPVGLEVGGLVLVAAPSRFGDIRPRPWRRGTAALPWQDAVRPPRLDWRFPFSTKLAAEDLAAALPDVPLRLLHGKGDWLVDDALGRRIHERSRGSEFFLLDVPGGPHADDLLAAWPTLVLRLLRPFVSACLVRRRADDEGASVSVAGGPWRQALAAHLDEPGGHSPDLGGLPPRGAIEGLTAVPAGRDGVHLAFRVGRAACWARGLRDGSVHGLNLLETALAADGPTWPSRARAELQAALEDLDPTAAARREVRARLVRPRGVGGLEIG